MTLRAPFAAMALAALISGCAHQNDAAHSGPRQADAFEKSHDPPIQARTYFAAGQLAESEGRLQQAVSEYKRALAEQPGYLDAMYRLGVVYARMKDYANAIETWNRYVTATHGSATAYSNLGFCQELAGNPAAAEAAYSQGIAKDPKSESCRINYGLMLARHGRPNEALLQLQVVLPPAKAHYDLASVYETQGRRPEARIEYHKAVELDPNLEDARARLAALPN